MKDAVRFWVWWTNGMVKLTIRKGQSIVLSGGGPTDEGWSSWGVEFTFDGDTVTRTNHQDGCDCDGRLSSTRTFACRIDRLASVDGSERGLPDDPMLPDWQRVSACQRDYSAEAAGY